MFCFSLFFFTSLFWSFQILIKATTKYCLLSLFPPWRLFFISRCGPSRFCISEGGPGDKMVAHPWSNKFLFHNSRLANTTWNKFVQINCLYSVRLLQRANIILWPYYYSVCVVGRRQGSYLAIPWTYPPGCPVSDLRK